MQDDLLQYSCKSPKGGHAETNTVVPFHTAQHVLGDKRQTGLGGTHFRNPGFEYHQCHYYSKHFTQKNKTIGEKGKKCPLLEDAKAIQRAF